MTIYIAHLEIEVDFKPIRFDLYFINLYRHSTVHIG
jgi:hypothetical protein